MINWNGLISKNKAAVVSFATGAASASAFQSAFSGNPNPARCVVKTHGATYSRRLARKALRRRGVPV